MNLVKCPVGHFYDEERFSECPHCAGGSAPGADLTMPLGSSAGDAVTVPLSNSGADVTVPAQNTSLQDAVKSAMGGDDQKTVGFYKKSMGIEPVVGWLVCIGGAHFGEDFRLKSGRNFIGRAAGMDVVISKDNAVSRERHSVVVYEPKGHAFIVMPGESKELCYLNGEVVLTPVALKAYDLLVVGETGLMFIPCCGPKFNWDDAKKKEG